MHCLIWLYMSRKGCTSGAGLPLLDINGPSCADYVMPAYGNLCIPLMHGRYKASPYKRWRQGAYCSC